MDIIKKDVDSFKLFSSVPKIVEDLIKMLIALGTGTPKETPELESSAKAVE